MSGMLGTLDYSKEYYWLEWLQSGAIYRSHIDGSMYAFPVHHSSPMTETWCRRWNGDVIITTGSKYRRIESFSDDNPHTVAGAKELFDRLGFKTQWRDVYSFDIYVK